MKGIITIGSLSSLITTPISDNTFIWLNSFIMIASCKKLVTALELDIRSSAVKRKSNFICLLGPGGKEVRDVGYYTSKSILQMMIFEWRGDLNLFQMLTGVPFFLARHSNSLSIVEC